MDRNEFIQTQGMDEDLYSVVPYRFRYNAADVSDDKVITERVKFLSEAHIFFNCDKKQTFRVTNYEYQKCYKKYQRQLRFAEEIKRLGGLYIAPVFELNGCSNWIYQEGEDYSNMTL